jgi:hypothetical protein
MLRLHAEGGLVVATVGLVEATDGHGAAVSPNKSGCLLLGRLFTSMGRDSINVTK